MRRMVSLAEAIVRLLKDRELARRLGENGRQWMLERFTLTRAVDDLDELYARCLAEQPAGVKHYSLWRSLIRLPQLPFRIGRLMLLTELARLEKVTRRSRINNFVRRIIRRLRAAAA